MSRAGESLGAQIRAERKRRGMSQREAARFIGIAQNTLSALERGENTHGSTLQRALKALELEPVAQREGSPQALAAQDIVAGWIDGLDEPDRDSALRALGSAIAQHRREQDARFSGSPD